MHACSECLADRASEVEIAYIRTTSLELKLCQEESGLHGFGVDVVHYVCCFCTSLCDEELSMREVSETETTPCYGGDDKDFICGGQRDTSSCTVQSLEVGAEVVHFEKG